MNFSHEIEKVSPGIFHIHFDIQGENIPKEFISKMEEIGFYITNFSGHFFNYAHFEPDFHATLKSHNKAEYQQKWEESKKLGLDYGLKGYLEGEYISVDEFIEYVSYRPDIKPPFQIIRRKLSNKEGFRSSELHLAFRLEGSDPRAITSLLDAGFFGAKIPKNNGEYGVLTAQGEVRIIQSLITALRSYLKRNGGFERLTVKEERAINYLYLSEDTSSEDLPEVIDKIIYI